MSDAFYNALCDHQHLEGYEEGYKDGYEAGKRDAASPWHRVEDGLPPNAKHRGAFCPKYHVMTKWGVTDGWFNPDVGENGAWRVLLWFFQGTWDEWDIDFERGDKPKLAWVSQRDVFAWMPIEPPVNKMFTK